MRGVASRGELTATMDGWVRAAFRVLAVVLLTLLAISTVSIVLLNVLYDPSQLRPRQLWRPVVYRNAILAVPALALLYFSHRRVDGLPAATADRLAAISTKLLRTLAWLSLAVVMAAELVVLAENLLIYQELSLTRTPRQTSNLLHAAAMALVSSAWLVRRRRTAPGSIVSRSVRTTLLHLAWDVVRESALVCAGVGALFLAGFFLFFDGVSGYPLVLAAAYVLGGIVCGAFLGGSYATRKRIGQIVRVSYALIEPLLQPLLQGVATNLVPSAVLDARAAVATGSPRSFFARLAHWQFRRSLQRHWISDFLPSAAASSVPAEQALADGLIRFTAADLEARFRLIWWAALALTTALWLAPVWLPMLLRAL